MIEQHTVMVGNHAMKGAAQMPDSWPWSSDATCVYMTSLMTHTVEYCLVLFADQLESFQWKVAG